MSTTLPRRRASKTPACPACRASHTRRLEPSQVVRHSRPRTTTRRVRQRFKCQSCRTTFRATTGTVYARLRASMEDFDRAIALATEGMSQAAVGRVLGRSPSTISRWIASAAKHAERFTEARVHDVPTREVQIDELRTSTILQATPTWVHTSVAVESRLWLGLRVGTRAFRHVKAHLNELQSRLDLAPGPLLIVSDGYAYTGKGLKAIFRSACVHVEVIKRFENGKIVRSNSRVVQGAPWRAKEILHKSLSSRVFNTSFVERLNLTIRRSIAALNRRTNALCRTPETLARRLELLRVYYNFVREHASLGRRVTPAMEAGLVKRRLTLRDVFMSRVPELPPTCGRSW
ncbi:hypothetical protein Pla163_10990 [Planctomycetes bacterium Pla163]|uniref:Transposase IS30-like HTH domain-containing protein n=1 Tax=Rohdeia mirabilis TaxID=2528008 RepID=A0A518CXQ9_9BACT|nr:hypothetical protein Pla163_10990 [Planctomycetes bacterium Pla163]